MPMLEQANTVHKANV